MSQTFKPHDYQQEALAHLYKVRRGALWMPMGGGKTVTTLTALEHLSVVEDVYPALVLAPLRVARSTWPSEVGKWAHLSHLRVSPIVGTPKQRERALAKEADIYCTNYDNIGWLRKQLGEEWPFKTVIADEFTRLKSFRLRQGGTRARSLGEVAHTKVRRFIGLTGTPAPNGLKDLWGQMWFLDKGERLGRTFSAFEMRWFMKGYDGYSIVPQPHAQEEIQGRLKDICLTVKGLDVDEPLVAPVYVDLIPSVRQAYDTMERHMFAELASGDVEAANAAVRTQKCLQMANGAIYLEDGTWDTLHDAKLAALESIIEEANGAPVMVAYHFKHDLERLRRRFPHGRVLDTNPDTISQWNAGKIQLLFAHPACLTPQTEVLTENRGWVRIIDVRPDERVHDGVEFVGHRGCSFSGIKPVIDVFGIGMTLGHKLLIGGNWVEASRVRDTGTTSREARYSYAGDDHRLRALLDLPDRATGSATEREPGEPLKTPTVQVLSAGHFPRDDRHAYLAHLERHGEPLYRPEGQGLSALRRGRAGSVRGLACLRKLLSGYARRLFGRTDDRPYGQLEGLLSGELPLGAEPRAAIEQAQQPGRSLSGPRHALGRVLPSHRSGKGRDFAKAERWDDGRRGAGGLQKVSLQAEPETSVSPVFDLVDCGPRNRFLIRNDAGEVFVSHNSAGHGLNLADGGNILAFFGVNWNLEEYMQIIERIGPMRQKQAGYDRPCLVYPILARNTVDEMVMERLSSKRSVQEVLLEAMKRKGKKK